VPELNFAWATRFRREWRRERERKREKERERGGGGKGNKHANGIRKMARRDKWRETMAFASLYKYFKRIVN